MKTQENIMLLFLWIGGIMIGFGLRGATEIYSSKDDKQPKIFLPNNYKKLDGNSAVIVQYDSIKNVIIIEHDNSIQFKWEGLERDIPEDGIRTLQLSTNENTIYLNPVDE